LLLGECWNIYKYIKYYNLPGYSRKYSTEKTWHEVAAKVNKIGIYHTISGTIFVKNLINVCKYT